MARPWSRSRSAPAAASAKTVTLHYFSKQTSSTFVTPQGKPITGAPAVGDVNDNIGIDYVGNHTHHARKATGSDRLRCTITSFTPTAGKATCDGQIAIGASMLLANHVSVTVLDAPKACPIKLGPASTATRTAPSRRPRSIPTPTSRSGSRTDRVPVTVGTLAVMVAR